jgi:hypothetical protein
MLAEARDAGLYVADFAARPRCRSMERLGRRRGLRRLDLADGLDRGDPDGNNFHRFDRHNRQSWWDIGRTGAMLPAGYRLDEGQRLRDQFVAIPDPLHDAPRLPPFQQSGGTESSPFRGIAYFSRLSDIERMDAQDERSVEVQGLRLVRAFLSLPPDKRALVIEFIEEMLRASRRRSEDTQVSPG